MTKEFNYDLCEEKHLNANEKFSRHESMLFDHEVKIERLIKNSVENSSDIKFLIKQLKVQTASLWGLVVIILGATITYFFTK